MPFRPNPVPPHCPISPSRRTLNLATLYFVRQELRLQEPSLSQPPGRVLTINPGSTSTKFGIYTRAGAELEQTILHGDEELARFKGRPMVARLDYRAALIAKALEAAGYSQSVLAADPFVAIAGRGADGLETGIGRGFHDRAGVVGVVFDDQDCRCVAHRKGGI